MKVKQINIGGNLYNVNFSKETAMAIQEKIIEWMENDHHYSAHSGEGIMQNDNTIIDAPVLISDIIDEILQPKYVDLNENQ